ncbi:MAG: protein kinase domain-containing protein [Candidatus Udaeobacter sp.]
MSCLLRNGLEGGDDVSQALFQTGLAEVDAPHKSWFLGNYEILEQIGCGGMGVIYRARQRHSRRIVAVKRVLSYRADSHGALQRFRREAQAVASLDHPNILPIYEVSESEDGLPFFSMKLAEKGSLQENTASLRDEPRNCVQLMAKVAHAVEYAHSRGVLHRDLKPGNILLNDRGEPLVSDFGLAKLLDGNNDLTRSLTTFGTAGFIAPEQAGDAAVALTPVADVYSLGAVLFNLLTGRPPFLGSNPVSVIRQASETQAPKLRSLAPSLDRDLETICARCLERDPKARYQSARDLAADLERWLAGCPIIARPVSPPARIWRWSQRNPKLVGAATAGILLGAAAVWLFRGELFTASQFNPPDRSIAVLPFTDSSEAKDQKYLCDGITEEVLNTLARVDGLRVAGRTSSFSLKGKNTKQVGEKLNVGNVLEGSLQRHGNRVRVTAELIDARNGFRVWTETYDRELNGAFALQDEIARSVADAVKIKFAVPLSAHEQPGNGAHGGDLQGLFADVTYPVAVGTVSATAPVQTPSNQFTLPDHRSSGDFESRRLNTPVAAAAPATEFTTSLRDRPLVAGLPTSKITADVIAGPPETAFNTNVGDRALETGLRKNKLTGDVSSAPRETALKTALRTRPVEADLRGNKLTMDGSASLQGFVRDTKGEPIKDADVRIESRDGKQVFSTVKTDTRGRYISQGLQPGVYRVTLVVSGAVKSSIRNTQTKANQATQLNFDFKTKSEAGTITKSAKHVVWMPGRTGTHIGGNWVEVDDNGEAHSGSNIQTVKRLRRMDE